MNRRALLSALGLLALSSGGAPAAFAQAAPSPLRGYLRTNWSRDPFAYGSYSHFARGARDADRARLAAPLGGRLFFAGEALNPDYQTTVHAAHESGLRAADDLMATPHRRIGIVGAGMAGLTAAHALAGAGRSVVVLEGRERIGGRVWTDRSLGAPLDLGASWIHGADGNPLTALADQAGLARVATDEDAVVIRGARGERISPRHAPTWLERAHETLSAAVEPEKIDPAADARFEIHGDGYEGEDVVFPGGYDRIFAALRGDYEIRLGQIVRRVAHDGGGARIAPASGAGEAFDAVLVTVPLGVLKRGAIAFDPPLPPEKTAAIARMGMGLLDKLCLRFEAPFWDADATWIITAQDDLPPGQFAFWLNLQAVLGLPVLMGFNAGEQAHALSALSDDDMLARALRTLRRAYPA